MTNENTNPGTPSDDPRDFSLPFTTEVDLPDNLPDDVDVDQLPDEETIEYYTGPVDFGPNTNTLEDYLEPFEDLPAPDARVAAILLKYEDEPAMHPQELATRAGISDTLIVSVLERLKTTDLIRQSRVVRNVPFYEFNPLSESAQTIREKLD